MTAGVEVIVATRNRHQRLARTLLAIARLEAPSVSVIVVDDASDIAAKSQVQIPPGIDVEFVRLPRQSGPARARNVGVGLTKGPIVAFVDDDVDVGGGWLAAHRAAMETDPGRTVSIGPLLAPPDWRPTPWNRWEASTLAAEYARMRRGDYEPTARQFFTGNAMLSRDLFVAAGGFDEEFTRAEDVELGLRLEKAGGRFVLAWDAIGWHYARRTLKSWRMIPRQYACYDQLIARKHSLNWQEMVNRELASRNGLTRGFLKLAERQSLGRLAIDAATAGGVVLSQCSVLGIGHKMLSLAWQGEYVRARHSTGIAGFPDGPHGVRPGFNRR